MKENRRKKQIFHSLTGHIREMKENIEEIRKNERHYVDLPKIQK